jgi:hypothetical protein
MRKGLWRDFKSGLTRAITFFLLWRDSRSGVMRAVIQRSLSFSPGRIPPTIDD